MNKILYCKETGEPVKPNGDCLIHGACEEDHFEEETNNIKQCAVCDKSFYCEDDILKVCSIGCARENNA